MSFECRFFLFPQSPFPPGPESEFLACLSSARGYRLPSSPRLLAVPIKSRLAFRTFPDSVIIGSAERLSASRTLIRFRNEDPPLLLDRFPRAEELGAFTLAAEGQRCIFHALHHRGDDVLGWYLGKAESRVNALDPGSLLKLGRLSKGLRKRAWHGCNAHDWSPLPAHAPAERSGLSSFRTPGRIAKPNETRSGRLVDRALLPRVSAPSARGRCNRPARRFPRPLSRRKPYGAACAMKLSSDSCPAELALAASSSGTINRSSPWHQLTSCDPVCRSEYFTATFPSNSEETMVPKT